MSPLKQGKQMRNVTYESESAVDFWETSTDNNEMNTKNVIFKFDGAENLLKNFKNCGLYLPLSNSLRLSR